MTPAEEAMLADLGLSRRDLLTSVEEDPARRQYVPRNERNRILPPAGTSTSTLKEPANAWQSFYLNDPHPDHQARAMKDLGGGQSHRANLNISDQERSRSNAIPLRNNSPFLHVRPRVPLNIATPPTSGPLGSLGFPPKLTGNALEDAKAFQAASTRAQKSRPRFSRDKLLERARAIGLPMLPPPQQRSLPAVQSPVSSLPSLKNPVTSSLMFTPRQVQLAHRKPKPTQPTLAPQPVVAPSKNLVENAGAFLATAGLSKSRFAPKTANPSNASAQSSTPNSPLQATTNGTKSAVSIDSDESNQWEKSLLSKSLSEPPADAMDVNPNMWSPAFPLSETVSAQSTAPTAQSSSQVPMQREIASQHPTLNQPAVIQENVFTTTPKKLLVEYSASPSEHEKPSTDHKESLTSSSPPAVNSEQPRKLGLSSSRFATSTAAPGQSPLLGQSKMPTTASSISRSVAPTTGGLVDEPPVPTTLMQPLTPRRASNAAPKADGVRLVDLMSNAYRKSQAQPPLAQDGVVTRIRTANFATDASAEMQQGEATLKYEPSSDAESLPREKITSSNDTAQPAVSEELQESFEGLTLESAKRHIITGAYESTKHDRNRGRSHEIPSPIAHMMENGAPTLSTPPQQPSLPPMAYTPAYLIALEICQPYLGYDRMLQQLEEKRKNINPDFVDEGVVFDE
ncbi:hypothetical protein LTS18_010754 [Coniosporium uncinatum]|uniref:Uncharacterized protein n=1 Tax=Coniosporium uncinatum TaxID=93489 RepID=A0ACC3DWK6_9PEZI|nr:hypothetical protein LTS18_010754 [Coniosporium uncinatum]